MGRFACDAWDTFEGPDTDGNLRTSIRFHLVKVSNFQEVEDGLSTAGPAMTIEDLRKAAFAAAKPISVQKPSGKPSSYRARSQAVRAYVLARAGGHCELTGKPAPFKTPSGQPYLEVHHTRRLSDDGPDDPRYVAAICPSVHREIHFGENGKDLNEKLISKLVLIEC